MWLQYGGVLVLGLALGLAFYRFFLTQNHVDIGNVTSALEAFPDLEKRVESAVQIVVNAIEQGRRELAANGDAAQVYNTPDEMANEVIDFVKEFVPQAQSISNESITKFIKSAVLIASTMTHQIAAAKATVAVATDTTIDPSSVVPAPVLLTSLPQG